MSANKTLNASDLHGYQLSAIDHIMDNNHCGLFLDMGLGKTTSTLTAINSLINEELEIDKVLVIAPKRVAESVWSAEIDKWAQLKNLTISKVIGSEKQRKAALRVKADIYTLGRDNTAWFASQYGGGLPQLQNWMLVIDESSSFKNHASLRFKALKMIQPYFKRVVLLTGTPAPKGLIDLWAQIYLLDRGERLFKTITPFREVYFRKSYNGFSYDIMEESEDQIHNKIKDICISMKSEDYLDLPERIDTFIEITLPPEIKKKYDLFERERVLEMIEGGDEITAMNAAALSTKLLQFAGGAIYDEDRKVHEIHAAKLDAAEEFIEAANGKPVLIAYTYKHELARLLVKLKKYKPVKMETDQHIKDWNAGKIEVMLMHPASGGHGLNLQEGFSSALWFSLNWSLELYQQFNKRLHRQGRKYPVNIGHLIALGTEDESVRLSLDGKRDLQDLLMEAVKAKIKKYAKSF
jgi:SNF2 family DNA or RNA helicase